MAEQPHIEAGLGLENYVYATLPASNCFRLLQLPKVDDRAEQWVPQYSMHVIDPRKYEGTDRRPLYHCLSYTWSNPHPDGSLFQASFEEKNPNYAHDRTFPIICDGKVLHVGKNLHDALKQLQRGRACWDRERRRIFNKEQQNIFHFAVLDGDLRKVRGVFLSGHQGIHGRDAEGKTPLHYASARGNLQIAQFLVSAGAKISAVDNSGKTPIMYARESVHAEMEDFLRGAEEPEEPLRPWDEHPSDFVWIDAICINQNDPVEKAAQVSMMDKIFGTSTYTFMWLGEEDHFTSLAKRAVGKMVNAPDGFVSSILGLDGISASDLKSRDANIPNVIAPDWLGLGALFSRQWFRRVWIIQEVVFSNTPFMFCGPTEFDFFELDQTVKMLAARSDQIGAWWNAVLRRNDSLNPEFFAKLLFEWKNWASFIESKPKAAEMFQFHELVRASQRFHATVPRDKIFALRGLCRLCPSRSFDIVPDYSISEAEVWTLYTRQAIVSSKGFDILSLAKGTSESRTTSLELPSWSISPDFGVPIIRNEIDGAFDAAPGMSLKLIHDMSDCKRLRVKGKIVAAINFVPLVPPFPDSLLLHHLEVLSVLKRLPPKYKHVTGQSRGESVWRTLCANSAGTDGTSTAPLSYGKSFKGILLDGICGKARRLAQEKAEEYATLLHIMQVVESMLPHMSSSNSPPRTHDLYVKAAHKTFTQDGTLPDDVFAGLQPVFEALDELADGECIPTREEVARAYTRRFAEEDDIYEAAKHVIGLMLPASLREKTSERPQEVMGNRTYGERLIDDFAANVGLDDDAALRTLKDVERQEYRFLELKELENDESFGFIRSSASLRSGRTIFVTEDEFVGLGSTEIQAGDEVWIIAGSQLPLVLRPHKETAAPVGEIRNYRFVCQAYVHGIMHGEIVAQSTSEDWQALDLL
jgi:hypothetical protein